MEMVRKWVLLSLTLTMGFTGVSWAQALSTCDYVSPESKFSSLSLGGNFHQFNDRYSDNSGNSTGGNLALRGQLWEDGPEWGYRIEGSARLRLTGAGTAFEYSLDSSGQMRRYLSADIFAFGGFNSNGVPGQSGLTVDAVAGAGWGRFRDVTPLAKALKIHDILIAQKTIPQTLTNDKLNELAQTIGKQRELGLEGVMKAIEQSLGTSLNVAAVLALQEALLTTPSRFCGMDVSIAIGYNVINPRGQNSMVMTAKANYATALDPHTELVAKATWRAPLPLETWTVDASASFHRTLSTTTDLSAMYRYQRSKEKGASISKVLHSIDGTLRLQLQTALSVAFGLQASYGAGYEEAEWNFDVSFQYDLF
jgi:hypothetical protein